MTQKMQSFAPHCKAFTKYDAQAKWSVAIGNFDGFHLGHQLLIQQTIHNAQKHGCLAGLVTFSPHPKALLLTNTPFYPIYDQQTKIELAKAHGLDAVFSFEFNRAFANLSPEEFSETLFGHLNIQRMVVGYDFSFGKQRSGSINLLKQLAPAIHIQQIASKKLGQTTISSSMIRRLLFEQEFEQTKKLLGRCWHFRGQSQSGQKLGQKLGFPTINIQPKTPLPLPNGVYLAYAKLNRQWFKGVMNFGTRPTVQPQDNPQSPATALLIEKRMAEIHLLFGFDEQVKEQTEIQIFPCKSLRPEQKFAGLEPLKAQIQKDTKLATHLWQTSEWQKKWLAITASE